MRACSQPKKVTDCTSGRKSLITDYAQFESNEEPPQCQTNAKRLTSSGNCPNQELPWKNIKPRPIRHRTASSNPTDPVMTTATSTPTSHAVPVTVNPSSTNVGTVTVAATSEETNTAIAALLSLGSDLPPAQDDDNKNTGLVLLVPPVLPAPPVPEVAKAHIMPETNNGESNTTPTTPVDCSEIGNE